MKAAIIISTLPRDAILQNPSVRSPDEMDVDHMSPNGYNEDCPEELPTIGKGGEHCYRCGGEGFVAGTPKPPRVKRDSKGKDEGKGK